MHKRGAALLTFLLLTSAPGIAQTPDADKKAPPPADAKQAPAASAAQMPDAYKLELLIRTTIIALNQANATGNYTVLRDLASPNFQSANDPARLAEIFAGLRARKLDLSPILVFPPKLVQPPAIGPDGRLRLTGFFDTKPERVIFDLMFEQVERDWRLFGVALEVAPPAPASAAAPAADGASAKDAAMKAAPAEKKAAEPADAKKKDAKTAPAAEKK